MVVDRVQEAWALGFNIGCGGGATRASGAERAAKPVRPSDIRCNVENGFDIEGRESSAFRGQSSDPSLRVHLRSCVYSRRDPRPSLSSRGLIKERYAMD